jgi:hypothetical protein
MCHCDAYTDQALAARTSKELHHSGSNRKKQRTFLVHLLHREAESGAFAKERAVLTELGARQA